MAAAPTTLQPVDDDDLDDLDFARPTGITEASDSTADTLNVILEDERQAVASIPRDDPYREDLAPPAVAHLNACERARRLPWLARDEHAMRMAAASMILESEKQAAMGGTPTSGYGSPQDREVVLRAAAQAVQARAERATSGEVSASFASRAAAAGQAYLETFRDLADAFDAAYVDWSGPSALSQTEPVDVAQLYQQDSVKAELAALDRPMAQSRQLLQSLIKSGNAKKLAVFVRAARALALEIKSTPPPVLSVRLNNRGQSDAVDDERSNAYGLISDLDALKLATRPPSLEIVANVLGQSRLFAQALFGAQPTYVVPSEFTIRGSPINSRSVDAARKPWVLSPSWLSRFLPQTGTLQLPGWTPIGFRASSGAISRVPLR